jgi:hypothetical protein
MSVEYCRYPPAVASAATSSGAKDHPTQTTSDPIAVKDLAAPAGRADDFSWPRPRSDATVRPEFHLTRLAAAPDALGKQGHFDEGRCFSRINLKIQMFSLRVHCSGPNSVLVGKEQRAEASTRRNLFSIFCPSKAEASHNHPGDHLMTTQAAVRDTTPSMFDRTAESMPRTQLAALQLDRLKKTLERAYAKVPHFRKAFDAAHVTP